MSRRQSPPLAHLTVDSCGYLATVSCALLGFAVVAGAVAAGAMVVSAALDAIVVSVAFVFFFVGVDLILIRVHVRFPLTVLQTSFVFDFVVTADAGPAPSEAARRSAAMAAERRMEERLVVTSVTYDDATPPGCGRHSDVTGPLSRDSGGRIG